jgi:hypothetical protein
VRRDHGKILELPEVRPVAHPHVECAIHPGKKVKGVAVCVHVLAGDAVYLKSEPDRDRWGAVLCEQCAVGFSGHDSAGLALRLACDRCVRYHFFHEAETREDAMNEQELLAVAEKEGLRSYRMVRDGKTQKAQNPFDSPLVRWAWNLGFRMGKFLDECKSEGIREPIPQ